MGKIFITGDVHSEICDRFSSTHFPEGKTLTRDDYVFIAGDFGVIWKNTPDETENYLLNWLNDKPWTTLFIGGNHENWDRLRKIPLVERLGCGAKLGQIRTNVFFVPNGTLITLNGKKIFCFGGAMSTDRGGLDPNVIYPGEGKTWWRSEIPSYEEMNLGTIVLENNNDKVDIIITHTMPKKSIECFIETYGYNQTRIIDPTANYLSHIKSYTQFDQWFCGHFHKDNIFDGVRCLYNDIIEIETGRNYGVGKHYSMSWE